MARPLGDTLPDVLHELLGGRDLATRIGHAILITTTDSQGWPHPALVSYGEVVAVDRRRLRLALYRTSGTSGNLRRNGKLTLCLLGPGTAYYIKTSARAEQEPGARLTGGITFDPGCTVEEALRNWQATVDGLRREA